MNEVESAPIPASLSPWVERIEVTAYAGADGCPLIHPPDPTTSIVWRTMPDGTGSDEPLVLGPRESAAYHDAKELPLCVRFRLAPGAAPTLLGVPPRELVGRVLPLAEAWGADGTRLGHELALAATDRAAVVKRLGGALVDRIDGSVPIRSRLALLRSATSHLTTAPGRPSLSVSEVANRLGLGERTFRDAFTAGVGVSPKRYSRLGRLRAALSGVRRRDWAAVAFDTGYYDQSHLTGEFRALMRVTPGAFAAGRLPTTTC